MSIRTEELAFVPGNSINLIHCTGTVWMARRSNLHGGGTPRDTRKFSSPTPSHHADKLQLENYYYHLMSVSNAHHT
jgi:hypothetical protein